MKSEKQKDSGLQTIRRIKPREFPPLAPPPLDRHQVLKWWERARADHWHKTQMPITYPNMGALLGLAGPQFHQHMDACPLNSKYWGLMAKLILDIEARKIAFPMSRQKHIKAENQPYYVALDLPAEPPRIYKISRLEFWSLFARCNTCGGNKFLPSKVHGVQHALCYSCIPPDQHYAVGGVEQDYSLTHEALKRYY